MTVHGGDQRAVGPFVDARPGMGQAQQARAEQGEDGAAEGPVQGQRIGVRQARATHGAVGVHRHADDGQRLQRAEETADGQPVVGHADPVVMVRSAKNAGDEHQADDHVQPLLQHLAVGAGQADQQVGEEGAHDHHPHAFDPQVNGPPAIEDGNRVVLVMQQRRKEQHGGADQPEQQHAFGGGEAAGFLDGHADVVEEDQHADDDDDLVRQGLLEQLVAGAVAEQVADDRGHAHQGPEHELDIGQLGAVQLGARLVRHHPVGRAHEAGEYPDDQQVGVDHLGDIERQDVQQRIRPQVLGRRQQAEHQLQTEQHHGDGEVPVGDRLRFIAHG